MDPGLNQGHRLVSQTLYQLVTVATARLYANRCHIVIVLLTILILHIRADIHPYNTMLNKYIKHKCGTTVIIY